MRVIAKQEGFYDGARRRKDSEFDWKEEKLASWVRPADEQVDKAQSDEEVEPNTLSALNKADKKSKLGKAVDKAQSE